MSETQSFHINLQPEDGAALANLVGQFDENLRLIEERTGVQIGNRGFQFKVEGAIQAVRPVCALIEALYKESLSGKPLAPSDIHLSLQHSGISQSDVKSNATDDVTIRTRKMTIRPRGENQQKYVQSIRYHDINFGIGPAGTGKTYLAVACAVEALEREEVSRILLVRPAVEAGEKLGFLPGDLSQKVDPYLRPLYDALYEMMGFEKVARLIEKNVIEIAPLAYMRGRTLNGSFVILDESQNTTREQMKMFLTRIGFGSTAVITGDKTQVDLPRGASSGLIHAMQVLDGVKGIGFTHFEAKDVVRHPIVQHIVRAYEAYEAKHTDERRS